MRWRLSLLGAPIRTRLSPALPCPLLGGERSTDKPPGRCTQPVPSCPPLHLHPPDFQAINCAVLPSLHQIDSICLLWLLSRILVPFLTIIWVEFGSQPTLVQPWDVQKCYLVCKTLFELALWMQNSWKIRCPVLSQPPELKSCRKAHGPLDRPSIASLSHSDTDTDRRQPAAIFSLSLKFDGGPSCEASMAACDQWAVHCLSPLYIFQPNLVLAISVEALKTFPLEFLVPPVWASTHVVMCWNSFSQG